MIFTWLMRLFVALVVVSVLFISFAGVGKYYTKKSLLVEPNSQQYEMIANAEEIICTLDKIICESMNKEQLLYQVIDLPIILDIGRPLYWSHYAITHKNDHGFEVNFTSHLFDDIAAVTMFFYHELQHVKNSDFKLYYEQGYELEQCNDHNRVKNNTLEFAKRLDDWFESEKGLIYKIKNRPSSYARLPGNTPRDCS